MNYRAKELDLKLPLFDAIIPSNQEHLERAVEMVLHSGKKKIAILGLSFKAATDDLRESPQVQLVKRLLGEGRQIYIWDDNVSLGRLIGSNRQYIEEVIPHIGSLLCNDLAQVVREALDQCAGAIPPTAARVRPRLRARWPDRGDGRFPGPASP